MKGIKALFIAAVAAIFTVAAASVAYANGNRLAPTAFTGASGGYEAKSVHYRKYRRGHRRYGRKYRRGHRYYGHRKYRRGHRYYGHRKYRRGHRHYRGHRRHSRRYYGGYRRHYPRYYGPQVYFGFGYGGY